MKSIKLMLLAIVLWATHALAFDPTVPDTALMENEFADLSASIVTVTTGGFATGTYVDHTGIHYGYGFFMQEGSGFVVQARDDSRWYVVTAAHVIKPNKMMIQLSGSVYWITTIIKVNLLFIGVGDRTAMVQAEVFYNDQEHDLAVLTVPKNTFFKPVSYKVGYTYSRTPFMGLVDRCHTNDPIAVVVHKRDESLSKTPWFEVRPGKIISGCPVMPSGTEDALPFFCLNDITLEVPIYPGDSGSPVVAWQNGNPIIIGVARARACSMHGGCYAYATRIDFLNRIFDSVPEK